MSLPHLQFVTNPISAQGAHAHAHRRETFRVPVLQLQGALLGHPVPAQAEGSPTAMGAEGEAYEESAGMTGSLSVLLNAFQQCFIYSTQVTYRLTYAYSRFIGGTDIPGMAVT